MRRRFAEILERHVAAEAEADQRDPLIARRCVPDDRRKVARLAAVVKAQQPVWLAAAAAEIPREHVPARRGQHARGAEHVVLSRVALQPVRENCHARSAAALPVEIEEIAVIELQPFALEARP